MFLEGLKNTRRLGGNKTQKQHKSIKCEFLVRSEEKDGRFSVNFIILLKTPPHALGVFKQHDLLDLLEKSVK